MRKAIVIHLFFLIISLAVSLLRIQVTGPDLIWNILLALLAYDLAFCSVLLRKRVWLYPILVVLWLVFYPNTFYMLTDIVHMTWVGDSLWNPQHLYLFLTFVASILFGLCCGVESWRLIKEGWKLSWQLEMAAVSLLSLLSSLAIYVGRYDRLNSWDLITRPALVLQKLLAALQKENLAFIFGFSFLQLMCLFFLSSSDKK